MEHSFLKNLEVKTASVKSEIETHKDERAVTHYITTPDIDWGGDVVDPKGMDSSMFDKHKTVFYNHNYDQPIASNMWHKSKDEGVLCKTRFGKTLFADDIYTLQTDGIINTWSIGWQPKMKDGKPLKGAIDFDEDKNILYINKWDLVEYSVAPLAMNPSALDQVKTMVKSMEAKHLVKDLESHLMIEQFIKEQEKEISVLMEAKKYQEQLISEQSARIDILEKDLADMLEQIVNKKEKVETLGEDYVKKYLTKLVTGEVSHPSIKQ